MVASYQNLDFNRRYSDAEKEEIFTSRTKDKYPEVWSHYTRIISHELLDEQGLAAFNLAERKRILVYAYENCPFYKNLYDNAGFDPYSFENENDWLSVPLINKQMVRENFSQMIVGGINGELVSRYGIHSATSGSTGESLRVIRDARYEQPGSTVWRSRGWWFGRPRGCTEGTAPVLGRSEALIQIAHGPNKDPKLKEQERLAYFPTKRLFLDAQSMTAQTMAEFAQQLTEEPGIILRGYTGALSEFARFCLDSGYRCRPSACSASASPVDPISRATIQKAFGCEVFDVYGSNEAQNMAIECAQSHGHLHVLSDLKHIEILGEDGIPATDEQEGTVYVTSFTNYIMPLIRYCMNDTTHWISEKCRCGLPFPLIRRIVRSRDLAIADKFGNLLYVPDRQLEDHPDSILCHQLVDHGSGRVTIKIIPDKSFDGWESEINAIREYYATEYRNRVDFSFEVVDSIPHVNGKAQAIVREY